VAIRPDAGGVRRAHVAINLGVLEVLDAADAGELIDIGGDSQQHPPDAANVNDDDAAVGVIWFGAQVDHRRVLAELKLGQPAGPVAQPLDLIEQTLGVAGVLRRRPAVQGAQLAHRRVETVEVRVADDRVYPCRAEPAAATIFRIESPSACALAIAHVRSSLAISRRHAARRTRASSRDSRRR
jgi:hypothetical protein